MSSHFIGQPIIASFSISWISLKYSITVWHIQGKGISSVFYAWAHLVVMLYAVVRCFLTPCEKSSFINNTIIIKSSI